MSAANPYTGGWSEPAWQEGHDAAFSELANLPEFGRGAGPRAVADRLQIILDKIGPDLALYGAVSVLRAIADEVEAT